MTYIDPDTIEFCGVTFRRVGTSQRPPDDLRPDDIIGLTDGRYLNIHPDDVLELTPLANGGERPAE